MNDQFEKPYSKRISDADIRNRKENSKQKFATIGEMKTHHNAIKTLYRNGYDKHALRHIAGEFQDSIQFALDEVNRMRDNMSEIINNTH